MTRKIQIGKALVSAVFVGKVALPFGAENRIYLINNNGKPMVASVPTDSIAPDFPEAEGISTNVRRFEDADALGISHTWLKDTGWLREVDRLNPVNV